MGKSEQSCLLVSVYLTMSSLFLLCLSWIFGHLLAISLCIGTAAITVPFWSHFLLVAEVEQTIHDRIHLNLPASYHINPATDVVTQRLRPLPGERAEANVSAIILNWSRFQNVREIVALLCSVDDVISEIVVWNNNPRPLHPSVRGSPSSLPMVTEDLAELFWYNSGMCCGKASNSKLGRKQVFSSQIHGLCSIKVSLLLHSSKSLICFCSRDT